MAASYDHLFKVLLIGDPGVEKKAILFRFSEDAFNSTIGEISVVLTSSCLHTRQSEILTNFLEMAGLIPLRT